MTAVKPHYSLRALTSFLYLAFILNPEDKMKFYLYSIFICYFYQCTSTKIKPEINKNILNFGYGINYKYKGMLVHSFDRFYVVTKFTLPSRDLNFSKLNYDNTCVYLDTKNVHDTNSKKHVRLNLLCFIIKD